MFGLVQTYLCVISSRCRRALLPERCFSFLVVLHVRGESCRSVVATVADGTLVRLPIVVCFHVNLQVVTATEGGLALRAPILPVTRVQFDVTVTTALVLEEPLAIVTSERHLIAMNLKRKKEEKNYTGLQNLPLKKLFI